MFTIKEKNLGSGPRNYTEMTIKRLFGQAGNQCSFPGCSAQLTNRNNAANSNICHIEAANEGGERYNPNMTDVQRADYVNLILFCPSHHRITNDVETYPVEELKKIKLDHETRILSLTMGRNPSMLGKVIDILSKLDNVKSGDLERLEAFDIGQKIQYNNITLKQNYH